VTQALQRREPGRSLTVHTQAAAALVGDDAFEIVDGASVEAFADAVALYKGLLDCDDAYLRDPISDALRILGDGFRVFGPTGVFTSFNGGKDAVVIMQLSRAALAKAGLKSRKVHRPRTIFFENDGEFEEVEAFVKASEVDNDLELRRYDTGFVDGLTRCIDEEHGRPMGFVLGTRRGDPNCGTQGTFEPSSDWMPAFMRVNPIIEWDYGHIWHFLRLFRLPYCSLYDVGYTSLGKKSDTWPNPALRKSGSETQYWPAYMLSDWSLERAGRSSRSSGSTTPECDLRDVTSRLNRCANPSSASLLIIGDEILKAKCNDSNAPYAARVLRAKGVPLDRVATVRDDLDDIQSELKYQMQRFDLIVTSGGVGPTHDDVTIKAVAAALNQRLRPNARMEAHLRKVHKVPADEPLREDLAKMTMLPELARLRFVPDADGEGSEKEEGKTKWPVLQCENVFILPGVPQFFEAKLDDILNFFVEGATVHTYKVVLRIEEAAVVAPLNEVVAAHPTVTFGSYPFVGNEAVKTVLTLEAATAEAVDAGLDFLIGKLPADAILRVEADETL